MIFNPKAIISFLSAVSLLSADTLVLRNGSQVDGSFLGGDGRSVRFAVGSEVKTYSISDVRSVEFSDVMQNSSVPPSSRDDDRGSQPPPVARQTPVRPEAAPRPDARYDDSRSSGPVGVELPAGTEIVVRLIDNVDSETDRLGQTYRASIDQPVVVDGRTVIPRGADAVAVLTDAQKSGKIQGKTSMTLDLQSITANGKQYDIATGGVTQASASRGARSAKVIGGTAALGAIIGAIAGGGKGAAIGTVAGAGAGTAAEVATSGQRVKIPSETRLTFALTNPLNL